MPHLTIEPVKWKIAYSLSWDGRIRRVGDAFVRKGNHNDYSIWSMEVNEQYRRQGIASVLMSECLKIIGAKQSWLYVLADNVPAIRLYQKFGYAVSDDLPPNGASYLKRHPNSIFMHRPAN